MSTIANARLQTARRKAPQMGAIGALLFVVLAACTNGALAAVIPDVTVFLAQSVCTDGTPAVFSPGCTAHQQTDTDPMVWRRLDWAHTDGQIEDAYSSADGYVNTFSYPPNGPFDAGNGDGGDLLVSDGTTVSITYSQNGCQLGSSPQCMPTGGAQGTVAGWWVGQNCGGTGWLSFDNRAPTGRWRSTVAKLAASTDPNACPPLDSAYTRWRHETAMVPIYVSGVPQALSLPVIISEHYAGASIARATSMERFVMAQSVGRVLWESWAKSPSSYDAGANCSGISPWSDAPGPRWFLQDRRCITSYQLTDGTMTGAIYGWPAF
jgi:hypothetical protein